MEVENNENKRDMGAEEGETSPRPRWVKGRPRLGVLMAVIGVIAALMCISILAPPVEAATWQDAVIAGAVTGGAMGAIGGSLIPGVGTAVGGLIGVTVGGIAGAIGWLLGEDSSGGGAANAQAMAKWLAENQRDTTLAKLSLGETNANNVAELAQRAGNYYQRSAYYASVDLYRYQTAEELPHLYDSDYVLDKAKVSEEMVGSVAGSYAVYNKILKLLDTVGSGYIGDYQKNSLTVGVSNTYGKSSQVNYDNQLYVRITSFCTTPAGKYVWLNQTDTAIIWNLGASTVTGNVVITDHNNDVVYSEPVTLAASGGYGIDLSSLDIDSGRYNVQLPDSRWIWTANAAEDYSNSGTVAPGIAVYARSGDSLAFNWGWAGLPGNQGFSTSGAWMFSSGNAWRSVAMDSSSYTNNAYPYLIFNYPDGSKTLGSGIIDLKPMIESIWNVSKSWRQVTYSASLAGQTSYQVLLDNGGTGADGTSADALYPPTWIFMPDYDQLNNMTPQQLLSVYYAYLNKLNATFQHSNIMSPDTINVSTDSFDLLIRGKVWDAHGNLVIGNTTAFTLYTTLDGLTLRKGQTSELISAGYIVTWADGYSSLMAYINSKGNVANPNVTFMDVGLGWTIEVEEITFQNQVVEEKDLTVDTLRTYVPPDLPDDMGSPPQGDDDEDWLSSNWQVFGVIAGAALLIFGAARENAGIAVVGLAIAALFGAWWYLALNSIDLNISLFEIGSSLEAIRTWLTIKG